jgi:transcription elongation factor GreB
MSKAFTRESDDAPEVPFRPSPVSALPPGTKNYVTLAGARRWREELERLIEVERPVIAASADHPDLRPKLQALDQRIHHLQQILGAAVLVEPPPVPWDQVRFGATVTVREQNGEESSYRMVGVEEIDIDRGWVSWLSPIARALLNARLGQRVRFKFPSGETELEVVGIDYESHAADRAC